MKTRQIVEKLNTLKPINFCFGQVYDILNSKNPDIDEQIAQMKKVIKKIKKRTKNKILIGAKNLCPKKSKRQIDGI